MDMAICKHQRVIFNWFFVTIKFFCYSTSPRKLQEMTLPTSEAHGKWFDQTKNILFTHAFVAFCHRALWQNAITPLYT